MKRFEPLDIFRGMTVFFMIIVNTPGNWDTTYPLLLHAEWHGFTPTDLVFPSFLFAVGNAMAFVIPKWADWRFSDVFKKLLKRFLIIFLLGFIMYWFPFVRWIDGGLEFIPFAETRIFGVLQRIAICYFLGALMIYFLKPGQLMWSSIALLFGYWIIMALFGDLGQNNVSLKLDQWLIGDAHLYKGYGFPFDPEGLLSSFPAIVNVTGGYLLGLYVRNGIKYEKLAKILLTGVSLLFLAYLWDFTFPINKSLWTSSFVLLTIGLDLIIVSLIIYMTELAFRKWNFNFFLPFGKNPLFIYLVSEYLAITLHFIRVGQEQSLYGFLFQNAFGWMDPYVGSFAFALTFTMICWLVARWMDHRKIYVRV